MAQSPNLAVLNVLAQRIARPLLARTKDPIRARRDLDMATALLPLPSGVRVLNGPHGLRLVPAGGGGEAVILYFHGGAYICGSSRTHRRLAALLARETGLEVIVPDYRLAPEHPAPAAFDDGLAVYRAVASTHPVILAGDSAGGGLAFAVLAGLEASDPRPQGIFAFSPWGDVTGGSETMSENADSDRILPLERLGDVGAYLGSDIDHRDPRLSPVFATFRDPPPCLIQVSRTEGLYGDSLRLAAGLRQGGGEVTLSEEPDAPHVWQLLDIVLPEARESLREVAAFVRGLQTP